MSEKSINTFDIDSALPLYEQPKLYDFFDSKEMDEGNNNYVLSRLMETESVAEKMYAILIAEMILDFNPIQKKILCTCLFQFIEENKGKVLHPESYRRVVVASAIRKLFATLEEPMMKQCGRLLSTGMHISIQMEFSKCIGRTLTWGLKQDPKWLSDEYPSLECGVSNFIFQHIDKDQSMDYYGALLTCSVQVLLLLNSSRLDDIVPKLEELDLLYILESVSRQYVKYNYLDEEAIDKLDPCYLNLIDESIVRIKEKREQQLKTTKMKFGEQNEK